MHHPGLEGPKMFTGCRTHDAGCQQDTAPFLKAVVSKAREGGLAPDVELVLQGPRPGAIGHTRTTTLCHHTPNAQERSVSA